MITCRTFLLLLLLFSQSIPSFGQKKEFISIDGYSDWMMHYYRNPQPAFLFDTFNYAVHHKKITKGGHPYMIVAFYAACLKNDTLIQQAFYEKLKDTKDSNFIVGFSHVLWQIHTDYSLQLLDMFLQQEHHKKYQTEFEKVKAGKYIDLWADPINHPDHLDMLWADFFATGNEASIRKIISKLSDLNSTDTFAKATADAAEWSLVSNAVDHEIVLDVCEKEKELSASPPTKDALETIVQTANKQRKKK